MLCIHRSDLRRIRITVYIHEVLMLTGHDLLRNCHMELHIFLCSLFSSLQLALVNLNLSADVMLHMIVAEERKGDGNSDKEGKGEA